MIRAETMQEAEGKGGRQQEHSELYYLPLSIEDATSEDWVLTHRIFNSQRAGTDFGT
jgi:hypothetical protein